MQSVELNHMILDAFSTALQREVDVSVDFFDAGGDSLAAEQVLVSLSTQLSLELPGWLLLDYPNVLPLGEAIQSILSDQISVTNRAQN